MNINKKIQQIPASGEATDYIAGCPPGTILLVSFSGGKTSAYMARRLQLELAGHFILIFVFANTGQEREETLVFVDQCDREYGFGVVWVEAVIDPQPGNGTRHKVVNFHTAARDGEPFEEMIKKYGIPNKSYPHCTRELKEHEGNCAWCWKKSIRKHLRLINERPQIFDFPRRMEQLYPMAGASGQKQVFFRGHRSTDDLFGMARVQLNLFDLNLDDGCSESCEMYQAI